MGANTLAELSMYAARQGIPLDGMFELTGRCNLRCKFCYVCDRSAYEKAMAEKTTGEWLDMIRHAADAGMLMCTFSGGEPFLREDFEEIYCKTYDMGLRISIFTNAILIGERQRNYLRKRMPRNISVSLYGASENSYAEICDSDGSFHRAMESLDALCVQGFPTEIKALALKPLLDEYEAIGRIAAQRHCPAKIDVYLGPGRDDAGRLIRKWRVPAGQISGLINSFEKGYRSAHGWNARKRSLPLGPQESIPAIPCLAGKSTFMITHDGRMIGCPTLICFESFPFDVGFESAWTQLRDMVKHAQACEECTWCPDFGTCYLCPANRMKETGSIARCNPYLRELAHALSQCTQDDAG